MSYQPASQEVTCKDYPVQYTASGSSMRGIDISEISDRLYSILIRQKPSDGSVYYYSLLPLLEMDMSSVMPCFKPKLKTETYSEKRDVSVLLSKIVTKLMKENEVFKKLDRNKLTKIFSDLIENLPTEQLTSITQNELKSRIERVMAIETLAGILNDLSPEQIEAFDEAIKRRQFFK